MTKGIPQEDTASLRYGKEVGPQLKHEVFCCTKLSIRFSGWTLVGLTQRRALRMLEEILMMPSSLF